MPNIADSTAKEPPKSVGDHGLDCRRTEARVSPIQGKADIVTYAAAYRIQPGGAFGVRLPAPPGVRCGFGRKMAAAQEWGQDFQASLGRPVSRPTPGGTLA